MIRTSIHHVKKIKVENRPFVHDGEQRHSIDITIIDAKGAEMKITCFIDDSKTGDQILKNLT